jgi:formylglycine-generating enzyme required for sulfatase activity
MSHEINSVSAQKIDPLEPSGEPPHPDMAWVPGGTFRMGSEDFYPEEAPIHKVSVDGFWMDKYQVTNAQFARFVKQTGYKTVAERAPNPEDYPGAPPESLVPGSLTFQKTEGPVDLRRIDLWWNWTPGADWQHPEGPHSHIHGRDLHPVVHIAYEDAAAYAKWAGKELPTEAEWEFAARGGLDGATFVWGDEHFPDGKAMTNSWQGEFPWQNLLKDGFEGTAPVGSFPANGYGLYDMAGNAWEWTDDWWTQKHTEDVDKPCCIPHNPRGGKIDGSFDPSQPQFRIPRKVVKGGSHLCAPNYCLRYRPAARRPQMIDTGTTHIGFRCIIRVKNGLDKS